MGMKVIYKNKNFKEDVFMTKLSAVTEKFYLVVLASIGAMATWFALMSTSSSGIWLPYQPKLPNCLIKRD